MLAYAYGARKTSGEKDRRAGSFLEIRTVYRSPSSFYFRFDRILADIPEFLNFYLFVETNSQQRVTFTLYTKIESGVAAILVPVLHSVSPFLRRDVYKASARAERRCNGWNPLRSREFPAES